MTFKLDASDWSKEDFYKYSEMLEQLQAIADGLISIKRDMRVICIDFETVPGRTVMQFDKAIVDAMSAYQEIIRHMRKELTSANKHLVNRWHNE